MHYSSVLFLVLVITSVVNVYHKKSSYNYQDLIKCANGGLFGPGNAKLPLPPMLMFDRITEISENKGTLKKGLLKAELDIKCVEYLASL